MLKKMFNKQAKPSKRTKEEVNQEYAQLCAQLGENTLRIDDLEKVNTRIKSRIREIGQEMQSIELSEATAKAQAAKDEAEVASEGK